MADDSAGDKGIGFLLADVSRLLRRDFDGRVRGLGMTQAQWRAIVHISRDEGINQVTLAERLEVKPITIARLIDRMETAGWVERHADLADRRMSLLFLSEKAKPLLARMEPHADAARARLMRGIPRTTRRVLVEALERMKENLTAGPESGTAAPGDNDDNEKRRTG